MGKKTLDLPRHSTASSRSGRAATEKNRTLLDLPREEGGRGGRKDGTSEEPQKTLRHQKKRREKEGEKQ